MQIAREPADNGRMMMNKLTTILLLMFTTSVFAGEAVNKTMDADPNGRVSVSNIAGKVTVEGWQRDQVEVTGELGPGVKELIFEQKRDGKETVIKVKVPRFNARNADADLLIRVPQNSSLEVSTVSANITVQGVRGEQELHSVSGDVITTAAGADIELGSVSGDIEVRGDGANGEADLGSVSGDIRAINLGGELSGGTVSGDIEVEQGLFSKAKLESTSGKIAFYAGLAKGGSLSAETVNGSIDLKFGGDVDAEFEVETFNGKIKNCFGPKAERSGEYAPGWELRFTQGEGNGRVSVDTLNGSVRICND